MLIRSAFYIIQGKMKDDKKNLLCLYLNLLEFIFRLCKIKKNNNNNCLFKYSEHIYKVFWIT